MNALPKWKLGLAVVAFIAVAVGGGFAGGLLYGGQVPGSDTLTSGSNWGLPRLTSDATGGDVLGAASGVPLTFADVADRVLPAVVSVRASGEVPHPQTAPRVPDDFRRWFDMFVPPSGEQGEVPPEIIPRRGEGTGFVISADGFIVTNSHVVDMGGASNQKYFVTFADGTERPASLVGHDSITDVAVLKVDAGRRLSTVPMGSTASLRPGDWVVAIGNPFGLQHSVTAGIVSAFREDQMIQGRRYSRLLQTDAAINHGNSGGPLINLRGEVVGINTAIVSPGGVPFGFAGVGFAIPIDPVQSVVQELIKSGAVTRPWIGVSFGGRLGEDYWPGEVTKDIAARYRLPAEYGAYVGSVVAGGPAEKAGLRAHDIIVSLNGRRVTSPAQVQDGVWGLKVGETIELEVVNQLGRRQTVMVRMDQRPPDEELPRVAPPVIGRDE